MLRRTYEIASDDLIYGVDFRGFMLRLARELITADDGNIV